MQLIFSHGQESGPWGFKIRRLAPIAERLGCAVDSIDYRDCPDPEARVLRLRQRLAQGGEQTLLVGSSMGGYVSLVASADIAVAGLFLIAPALFIPAFEHQHYPSRAAYVEVVHGWSDDVIPAQHSIDYARSADCNLHLISGDHSLNDSIAEIETLFERFLLRVTAATTG